jgi:hypothetical protein
MTYMDDDPAGSGPRGRGRRLKCTFRYGIALQVFSNIVFFFEVLDKVVLPSFFYN